jgi:hyperosmotically inducible periplasmic protein
MNASQAAWCRCLGRFAASHQELANQLKEKVMKYARALAFAIVTGATLLSTGCSVIRGQEPVGAYVDDASITTAIKAKFVEDKTVDAGAIKVETLKGAVALSGFAKSNAEKAQAEYIARNTKGVKEVHNNLVVRP